MHNLFTRTKNFIKAYREYKKQYNIYQASSVQLNSKSIVIEMNNTKIYSRYYYTLIKFFSIAGYSIYFPDFDFKFYRINFFNKPKHNYYRLLIDDNILILNSPPKNANVVFYLKDDLISPDYFSKMLTPTNNIENTFLIPMAMHPSFYYKNLWNMEIKKSAKRKKSIFMAGNFNKKRYSRIKSTPFAIESRIETYNYLNKNKLLKNINSVVELNSYIQSSEDNYCILLDTKKINIPMSNLRQTISLFNFFISLPGTIMPLSHNLVEALSTGTIPIIHSTISKLMIPNLEDMHNAIIYENLADLVIKINLAYNIGSKDIKRMQHNVNSYYQNYLTPKAVINTIITKKHDTLFLQAEYTSVKILRKSLNLSSKPRF